MPNKSPYKMLPVSALELNDGQLEGLPKNPRYIREDEYTKLKRSIQQSPEFLEARMLLVYPLANGHHVVIAGNMRLRACRELGFTELPCYVFAKETPIEKLREYTIKDNASFGNWDFDILANESWSDNLDLLAEWGAPVEFLSAGTGDLNLDELYEEAADAHEAMKKDNKITIEVPDEHLDKVEDIRAALKVTLEDWEGCKVK